MQEVVVTAQPLSSTGTAIASRWNARPTLDRSSPDATKLRQILLNLLSNASKFTSNGVITLSVHRDKKAAGDWIDIQVRDTGIGIAKTDLPKLFQDFGQATASTSSKFGGTGLGLALSQKLCALMGGGISIESELGRGSRFTIRVPAVLSAEDGEHEAASAGSAGLDLAPPGAAFA